MPAKAKGYKKLTNRQKEENKKFRKMMREEGILPPVKPRLNRKKFAEETLKQYRDNFGSLSDMSIMLEAISWMSPILDKGFKITSEEVGILKLIRVAVDLKKFKENMIAEGKSQYKVMDLYNEVIKPIKEM